MVDQTKYKNLNREELLDKLGELEEEFVAFHDESKELEEFLESELDRTCSRMKQLETLIENKGNETKEWRTKVIKMNQELQKLREMKMKTVNDTESKIKQLSKSVVNLEVINDTVKNDLRIKDTRLEDEIEKSNAYVERIAVLENDLYIQNENLDRSNRQNSELQRQLDTQVQESKLLDKKVKRLQKILHLATMNRDSIRVSKYQTPPVK
ncbi:hypothetical protein FOA43_004203 [Brettanomyces nanus]|uniref:Uncharacterized protein n=1 Tax=Eeniella nana TaxID=13502 RepID=A0A875SB86_EENNA|nr:uncharacterized protein FOA43_004203 [Brettanomyces nanus]QPG76809.1 hypothetical protein FOA43_004203 [Brettanomyces nanus]